MKSSFENMRAVLSRTSLYDIDAKNVSNELMAYADVFDEVNKELRNMMDECFVSTAKSFGLSNRERVIGKVRDDLDELKRREMLLLRGAMNSQCFTVKSIKEALKSFGLVFSLYEFPSQSTVVLDAIGEYSDAQKAWICSQVQKIMPAHLFVQVIFSGPTWTDIDTNNNTFDAIDSKNYIWQEIDNLD